MKLLIITQKVDKEDPTLGFFHEWILEFSKRFEKVSVICLEKGKFDLPENIQIFSLGKESGRNKVKYIKNFLNLILGLHKDYNSVFVHMNQEYILMGGFIWKILGKKIYFWRNHPNGGLLTRIAVWFSNKVFCTSSDSFTARFKKTVLMPVGIGTKMFNTFDDNQNTKKERRNKVLFLGRMSPIKKPELLIEALGILNKKNINFEANLYGDPLPKDQGYYNSLKNRVSELGLDRQVNFYKSVPNCETPKIYNEHDIFVNLTPSGSFDKTILEAAACGCIPIVANKSLASDFGKALMVEDNPEKIAEKIGFWLNVPEGLREETSAKMINYVKNNHSLGILTDKLRQVISS